MRFGSLMTAAFALSLALGAAMPAQAQDDIRARGDKACNSDAKKLCSKFFGQGDMVMLQCFQEHKARLSRPCHKFLTEVGQLH